MVSFKIWMSLETVKPHEVRQGPATEIVQGKKALKIDTANVSFWSRMLQAVNGITNDTNIQHQEASNLRLKIRAFGPLSEPYHSPGIIT